MLTATSRAAGLTTLLVLLLATHARADTLAEPRLKVPVIARQQPHVALTLDACSGKTDDRILSALIDNRIPATIFVTRRWLLRNPAAVKTLLAHKDLFQIENHGARHVPAVDRPAKVFGIKAAGSPEAVRKEVADGAAAVLAATGRIPRWYRGATGKYSAGAMTIIGQEGEAIAGYSLIADDGAQLGATATTARILKARDGDVIIAHINHPEKTAGEGLVAGILALKAKGYVFVKLGMPARKTKRRPMS